MDNNTKPLNIALLPWLAWGHLIPFLHLAKLLAQKGHSIFFISTPINIKRLPKIPPNLANKIRFVELSLPSTPGLPHGAETTSELSYIHFPLLKLAFDGLAPQFAAFMESSRPQWLILDFAPYWAVPIASELSVKTVFFSIYNASSLVFIGPFMTLDDGEESVEQTDDRAGIEDWTVKPKWVPFESNVAFRYFEALKMFDCLGENVSGVKDGQRIAFIMRNCDVISPRSDYEFAPEWLRLLEDICQKPVVPVGHLPPTIGEDLTDTWRPVKAWLDNFPAGSMVYVAFGSESTLSNEELTELALGLEASELPFFWVLKTQVRDLPKGFQDRTKERGLVWTSWAPQLNILSHDSVGGFLTHSGWSSVIEGIMFKKPLILFPMFSDQGLMARVLEGKRLGYAIPREEIDGSFTRKSVAESVRMVIMEEEGKEYRENVKEMSRIFGDIGRQQLYVDEFANHLQTHFHGK